MDIINTKPLIYKLNTFCSRFLMPIMAVLFVCTNTVLNLWIGERIETVQNLLAIIIVLIVAVNVLSEPKKMFFSWVKYNAIILIYFIVRLVSLWQSGFDYSVMRTIFFEVFFILGICNCIVNCVDKRDFYIKFFIWFELIITFLCIALFIVVPYLSASTQNTINDITYYDKFMQAALFSNINTAGIMAGFAILISIVIYNKNMYNKKFVVAFGVYNVIMLIFFGSRAADVGIIVVVIFMLLKKIIPKVDPKKVTCFALVLMVLSLAPLYIFIGYHESKQTLSYDALEDKLNTVSSTRYVIWKECAITQKDDLFFGKGNLKREQEARKDLMKEFEKGAVDYRYFTTTEFGPHNGYISMISGAGILGFVLFVLILMQKIRRSKNLEKSNWYLLLIFIFTINCFESLFILNRFFTCFYMFLILESDWESTEVQK